ncbi:MAG: hypothetical protein ACAF41_07545 [Leptolyngbya sp. BL-A-14]
MNPADQPQTRKVLRSTEPPSLWLSLVLGSVLIHLVLFILVSLASTRTANVELELDPITVELVDPNTASVQSPPNRTIAARPGAPSTSQPSTTQAQPRTARTQPSAFNPSVEQPFVPPPLQRKRLPIRTRQPQPQLPKQPVPPTPAPSSRSTQPQPRPSQPPFPQGQDPPLPQPSATQPAPSQPPFGSSQGSLPESQPNPSGGVAPQPSGSQAPIEGQKITQGPFGESAIVTVSNPRQPTADASTRPPQPMDRQKNISLHYASALSNQTVRLQVTLTIDQKGLVADVAKATPLPSGNMSDEATLTDFAKQIFIQNQWQFEPAQDNANGTPVKPLLSNLIVDVEIQLP